MNESVLTELRLLASLLGQCLLSFREDFNTVDCKKPDTAAIIPSLVFKLEKLTQCAKSIQRLIKSLKEEDLPCLSCLPHRKDASSNADVVEGGHGVQGNGEVQIGAECHKPLPAM